jgi:hypothetical protein
VRAACHVGAHCVIGKTEMHVKLIACEVLAREAYWAAARSRNVVDIAFLPKGLHDLGAASMLERVQQAIDGVEEDKYDAVLLGYGLCNNGLAGVKARSVPIVIPRAHDCITLFLGDRKRYRDYFDTHPGVYFQTTGWMERTQNGDDLAELSLQRRMGMDMTLEQMIAKYGQDNGTYLFETLCATPKNYCQYTYIAMGVGPDEVYLPRTRTKAEERGWKSTFEVGDISLIKRLIDGPWDGDPDFAIVRPGAYLAPTYDDDIVSARSCVEVDRTA